MRWLAGNGADTAFARERTFEVPGWLPKPRKFEACSLARQRRGVRWLVGNRADTAFARERKFEVRFEVGCSTFDVSPIPKAVCALAPHPPHSMTLRDSHAAHEFPPALPFGRGCKFVRHIHPLRLEPVDALHHRRRSRPLKPCGGTPRILISHRHQLHVSPRFDACSATGRDRTSDT